MKTDGSSQSGRRVDGRQCTVLTYNIFAELPECRLVQRRIGLIASAIALEQPDLICLQELAKAKACGDTGQVLCSLVNQASAAHYHLTYARADGAGEGEWAFEEGPGLMTKLRPPDRVEVLKYHTQVELGGTTGGHHYRLPDDRVAIHSRVTIGSGAELDVYATHLTDWPEAAGSLSIRLAQARELVQWIVSTRDPRIPILLAGDFNDTPSSDTIRTLLDAGYRDAWAEKGSGSGYTNDCNDLDLESPDGVANQRIDYLLFQPGLSVKTEVLGVRLFLDRPSPTPEGGWLWASDHFGVLAKFELL